VDFFNICNFILIDSNAGNPLPDLIISRIQFCSADLQGNFHGIALHDRFYLNFTVGLYIKV